MSEKIKGAVQRLTPGERTVIAIEQLGLTGYQVQKEFELSNSAVSNWKNKRCSPRPSFVNLFCRKHNVSPTWILTGDGPMFERYIPLDEKDFLNKIDRIKKETKLSNQDIAKILNSYTTVISEIKAGKNRVKPEWVEIIEAKFGYIWNSQKAEMEIFKLREEIEMLKNVLRSAGYEIK